MKLQMIIDVIDTICTLKFAVNFYFIYFFAMLKYISQQCQCDHYSQNYYFINCPSINVTNIYLSTYK